LNPIFAAAAMSMSSVSVLTNALRLKRFRPDGNVGNNRPETLETASARGCC
jgi:hypothetical protein